MPVLEISGLKKSFVAPDGERTPVLDVASFEMEAGHQVGLEGASGSGKTTFLHIIAGVLQPDEGRVVVAGNDLTACSESECDRIRALHVGYVFQTFNLLQGYSALENVMLGMAFGKGADSARAERLLGRVGLGDRMNYRPRQLSVGQQQRVALARALANQPDLVLADEPTGNLDRVHAADALELLREVCRENDAALLLVSHDRGILDQFDTVHALDEINRVPHSLGGGVA